MDNSASLWVTMGLLSALGFRHGLDPDHIATVDGLTRMRARRSCCATFAKRSFKRRTAGDAWRLDMRQTDWVMEVAACLQ